MLVSEEVRELSVDMVAADLMEVYNNHKFAFVFADGKLLEITKED